MKEKDTDFCPTESLLRCELVQHQYYSPGTYPAKWAEWAEHKRTCPTCNPNQPSLAERLFGYPVARNET